MGIEVVVAADADRRAGELAAELGARILRTPGEVEEMLDQAEAAARAREVRGAETEARLLAAALEPGGAERNVASLLARLREARAEAARADAPPVLAAGVDPATVRAAAKKVRHAAEALREARADLGEPQIEDDSAERSIAAARAVLAGARDATPNATMRLGYVAAGNGIALLLVGLNAPTTLVVAVLGLVVIAGVQQLIVTRRMVAVAEGLPPDLDEWRRRADLVVAAGARHDEALRQWHEVAGPDADPDHVDALLATAVAPTARPAHGVTWPEREWAAALTRLELDPCPATAPDRALAQLARRLAHPDERERAGRRLEDLLEGRDLDDLHRAVAACAGAPAPADDPVVLADPLRHLGPSRRITLLRRLGGCDDDRPVTLVTSDVGAEAWLGRPDGRLA
jgi:hypothetical protein